jgi:hypothetical protein
MNRILALIMLVGMCSVNIQAQKKKSAARNNLKKVVEYEQKFDKLSNKPVKETETMFDEKGNIIEEIEYDEDKISSHKKYVYDENGNKAKEMELNAAGKITKTIEYKYDSEDRKIKEIETDASGKPYKISEYKYDGDLRTEKTVYDKNNKIKSKKTYQYQTY